MEKVGSIIFLNFLFIICLAAPLMVQSTIENPRENIDQWFQNLPHAKQKLTRLHFYFHDVVLGPHPTVVAVANASHTFTSPTFFGRVNIFDNPLTQGPEPGSKLVGRAQGLYGFTSQEEVSLLMAMNFVFRSWKHNGSSLTVLGRNPVGQLVRELPIVGGTGVFRLARGFVLAKTYFFNASVATVEYNVAALHY
ncbi:hypothetical protein ACFX13_003536 [Malus domestica]|uniref:Dirigent protein n=1 Tax=Malus domestica TaxID=3750 RepID=A0A498IZC3_MALDO|nr:hypothetical protein DVH24_034507 [Malus domestica]